MQSDVVGVLPGDRPLGEGAYRYPVIGRAALTFFQRLDCGLVVLCSPVSGRTPSLTRTTALTFLYKNHQPPFNQAHQPSLLPFPQFANERIMFKLNHSLSSPDFRLYNHSYGALEKSMRATVSIASVSIGPHDRGLTGWKGGSCD